MLRVLRRHIRIVDHELLEQPIRWFFFVIAFQTGIGSLVPTSKNLFDDGVIQLFVFLQCCVKDLLIRPIQMVYIYFERFI
jgi:hypothetical protein